MSFTLFPAIDLKDGQAVRLKQGRLAEQTVYFPDPAAAARRWLAAGACWLHVVDLDGAFSGTPQNRAAIAAIVAAAGQVPVQLGGGLRSLEAVAAALAVGVRRVIIGSRALNSDLVPRALAQFGHDRVVVGIDARDGLVATDGWVNVTDRRALDLAQELKGCGLTTCIYTDIARDGMLGGPNFAELAAMAASGLDIIASGGIATLADLDRLRAIPGVVGAILGKAIYSGDLDMATALAAVKES